MYITKRKYIITIAGTTLVATFEILLIPPSTTQATITVMMIPMINLSVTVFCSGVKKIEVIASVNWFDCIMHKVPIKPEIEKKTANGFHFGPNPDKIIYIGPPCTSPVSSLPLYITERVPSKNLVAIPRIELTHIQKIAPGPPIDNAIATPAMLPIPTVAAMALASASKELIWPSA